ncbi:MAG: hypothetical protein QMD09_04590 [Desulfatibacillaceae bacterium]|nr:hypothetical protein [Desulfatibacillaceae bacterium]
MKNLVLVLSSILCLVLILEGIFTFLPRSFGTGIPLAERNWFAYYWRPANHLGYRDLEVERPCPEGIVKIAVLGDSIVAGHGIKDFRLRFSDLLAERLGPGYRVYNLGVCGSDTRDQLKSLMNFPVTPDMVILAHYDNDIPMPKMAPYEIILSVLDELNTGVRFVVDRSFLANYLYWRFAAPGRIFEKYVESAETNSFFYYLDKEIFGLHKKDLEAIQDYCERNRIGFLPVLFPEMGIYIEFSRVIVTQPLTNFFLDRDTPVLDVYPLVKSLPRNLRTVNQNDQHPSPLVHAIVAKALYSILDENGLLIKHGASPKYDK